MIQLIPYGRDHSNPPERATINWDTPQTEVLVRGACFDCHSNQTVWPWYSNVAPTSWLLARDIGQAKNAFNFDELTPEQAANMVGEMVEKVQENEMPPFQYQIMHPTSRLSGAERQQLIDGLLATFNK